MKNYPGVQKYLFEETSLAILYKLKKKKVIPFVKEGS